MKILFGVLFLTIFALAINPRTAFGQIEPGLENGLKLYGSYNRGAIDSIHLSNGNVVVHFPIYQYAQRGSLPFELNVNYNSKKFTVGVHCDPISGDCTSYWGYVPPENSSGAVALQSGRTARLHSTIYHSSNLHQLRESVTQISEKRQQGSAHWAIGQHAALENRAGMGIEDQVLEAPEWDQQQPPEPN